MAIQELVLDFVNVRGQELGSQLEDNGEIEEELETINSLWYSVKELVLDREKGLKEAEADLSDFEEDLKKFSDVLTHTEVCLEESEKSREPGMNGLQKQLAKLKVLLQ